jgi:hypothetical protein
MLAGVVEDAVLRHGAGLIGAGDDLLDDLAFPLGQPLSISLLPLST